MNNMKEISADDLEKFVGGTETLPPLPSRVKATIYELVVKWKKEGYTLDHAIQAAKAYVAPVYAAEVEAYVRSIWDTV